MTKKYYEKLNGRFMSSAQLADSIHADRVAKEPTHRVQMTCTSEDCNVNGVVVQYNHMESLPPPLECKCPVCGQPLQALHYVVTETYVPVSWSGN